MSNRRFWEEHDLNTPEQLEEEEGKILEALSRGASGYERASLLERLKNVAYAKQFVSTPEPQTSTPTIPTTTTQPVCKTCLAHPCLCEGYKR